MARIAVKYGVSRQTLNNIKKRAIETSKNNPLGSYATAESVKSNIKGLVERVYTAWDESDPQTLNDLFLTLQSIMIAIVECGGKNNYKLPHLHKDKLKRAGRLPDRLWLSDEQYAKLNADIERLELQWECEQWLRQLGAQEKEEETRRNDLVNSACPPRLEAMLEGFDVYHMRYMNNA
jgi:hypothetical protein